MAVSRRNFLAVTGAAMVAAVTDVGGLIGRIPAAFAAAGAPKAVLTTLGRGLFGGLTTLDQTVMQTGTPNAGGYWKLQLGDGEPHLLRTGQAVAGNPLASVGFWGYRQPMVALGAFVQITDMQIVDDQSPGRVEFTDRYADLPAPQNPDTDSAYRPQEFLSTHIVESMARAIRNVGTGPMTGLPFAFAIATGDMVDNVQYNEVRWYLDLLDGGHTVQADSGQLGLEQSVSKTFAYDSLAPNAVFHERVYWSPDGLTDNVGRIDQYRLNHGFPIVPGLLSAARRPFASTGLGMPWYAAMGNHDGEIQGNYPVHPSTVIGLVLPDISGHAASADKAYHSDADLPHDPSPFEVRDFVNHLRTRPVIPDANRRFLTHTEFAKEHWNTTGLPRGHGFSAAGGTYYTIPASDTDLIQYITIDTVNYDGGSNGRVPIDQYRWLEAQLKANSAKYIAVDNTIVTQPGVKDRLIVIFAHHTLDSTDNSATDIIDVGDPDFMYGPALEGLFLRFPNVVLMVVGHTHRNIIIPHARGALTKLNNHVVGIGGFWEVSTASHIDWPAQSRLIEIAAGDGVLSIFTTMVDVDSPVDFAGDLSSPTALASLARELAFNDPTELVKHNIPDTDRRGDPDDRNTQLLVAAPFPIAVPPPWGGSVAVGRDGSGRLMVIGTDTDDRIWQRLQPTAGEDNWTAWTVVDNRLFRAVAIGTNQDGRLEQFGVNAAGQAFHRGQLPTDGWSDWRLLGNVNARSIAATRTSDGRLQAFVTLNNGDVWYIRQSTANGASWPSWTTRFGMLATDPAKSSILLRKVAAETNSDGRVQVLGISDVGELWSRSQTLDGGWTDWTPIDNIPSPLTAIALTHNQDGTLQAYGVNHQRQVLESSQVSPGGAAWRHWVALDDGQTRMTQISAEITTAGIVEVYGVDHTGKTWRRQQAAANSRLYQAWADFNAALRPDVPARPDTTLQPPRTVNVIQADTGRYLDAHEIVEKDYQVVTRPLQTTDSTQRWVLTNTGRGLYTLMQVSSGRYLDAHESPDQDFRVVTRPASTIGTQTWLLNDVGNGMFTLRQVSTGQFLDAYETSANDFQVVTRQWKNANEERWRIVDV